MIKIDSFIVNKGTNSSSSNGGGGFANTIVQQKKLEKHKLWGQEFDGTQDIDGDMTINGNANISGNVTATNGNITNVNSTTINNNGNIVNGGNITNTGNLKTAEANVTNDLTVGNNANVGTVNATNGNITNINSSNITNSDTIRTKNLQVTGTAHFFNLIIDKIKSAGGAALFTPADGFDVDIVQDDTNEVKLLWQCQDEDGNQRDNMWKVNDQALCMSFNKAKVGTTHNVSNKYYWALVTGVNKIDEPLVVDGVKYNYITLSKTIVDGTLNPEFGDSIVMCGYRGTDDDARQSAIYISAYSSLDNGLTAPLLAQYQGINDFNLESHRNSYYDAIGAKFVGEFEVSNGQNIEDFINDKIKVVDDKYSSLSVTVDGINTKVVNNTTKITKLGENLETANNNITALETTMSNNYSTLDQKADGISAKVSENTTTINNINGQVTENKTNIANLTVKADGIESTVSSMKDEMIGENGMLGLNGQGWSSNTIYQDAANVFYCESTDWFQSHPIADFSGDYTFSFSFWGGNMQIKILDFTQTYYDDGIYDQYVDFSVYKPCKILTTSSSVSNVDLTNYATSGTSSTWTYTNTEAITLAVGDNVAVRVTNSTNNRYNSIYGTVSAINTSTKSVTVKAIALLDQPNTICTLSCPTDKKDGTDINSLHYDDKLGRYWIRFKESRGTAKTFVMQFRNLDTSSIGYISRLMIEEGVERPHKYNGTGQASQSMIKQTANEILAQVNDTYVKIGDGNITLNGDTKVNGSLTLNDSKQGFLLLGNGGTTEISPKSIGSYSAFKDRTSNVIRTHYLSDIHGELNVGTNNYAFFWSVTQKLGTYKKGDYIKLTNYTNDVVTSVGTNIGTPYAKFYITENGTQTKAIDIGVKTNVDIDNYTVVNDNADIQVTGQFHIYAPKSIWNQARGIDTNIPNTPFISVTVEWNNEVPNKNSFMLIGYDGFGVNFGTNKTVYCGAEGFIASYGDSLFKITSDGIVEKKNGANVAIVNGSSSIYSPSYYNLKEGVDTILCKSGYTIITLPSEPYQGQSVKIFDKSPQEVYVNFNGYMVGANSDYNSRTHQTKYVLDGTVVRTFTYIGDTWFMEYMG